MFVGDHCHTQLRNDDSSMKSARQVLIAVSVLCLIFMIGEIVGKCFNQKLYPVVSISVVYSLKYS